MKAKVVITDWGFPSLDPEREIFSSQGIDVSAFQCKTEDEVARVAADADIVMAQWAPVKRKAIDAMRQCKGIVRYGIGLDNIDLDAARGRGIPVRNVPDYCLDEVADHTMALLLALQRQVSHVSRLVRDGFWRITPPFALPPLRKSVLGLVGFGRIAQLVARRAQPFGLHVLASDPYAQEAVFGQLDVEKVPPEDILRKSDIVSLHCPLTPETKHLVNRQTLGRMKKTALLINTSRGGLIDTAALAEAMEKGNLAGVAVDVLEVEPIPVDHPLLKLPNAIVTSHVAWYSSESVRELQRRAALAAVELLKGKNS